MKETIFAALISLFLCVSATAAELPQELRAALPEEAVELLRLDKASLPEKLAQKALSAVRAALDDSLRGAVLLTLTALFAGAAAGLSAPLGGMAGRSAVIAGVLSVTMLAAGDFSTLIGLGAATMQDLAALTKLLLPTMAAAIAGSGGVISASVWQMGTLWLADVLMSAVQELLIPLVYCHIALSAAGAALPESGLARLADGLRKVTAWLLGGTAALFTLYLSLSKVLTGSADRAAVKAAQAAVSRAIPVVGSILSDATQAVFGAADSMRAAVGTAGILGVAALCLAPLARLGVQFLLYKAAAFFAAVGGRNPLERLLEQLGDAFGLILGMTAVCALLLLAALLVSLSMVVM